MEDNKEKKDEAQKEFAELKQKCDEYLNGWKRERADFLNYKKEEVERIGLLAQYSKEEMIMKFLPIIDSIHLAEAAFGKDGFAPIQKQIEEFFKKEGIEEVKSMGEKFNPETMEAVDEETSDKQQEAGIVIEELQKGYTINGKLLRPAKVKVSK